MTNLLRSALFIGALAFSVDASAAEPLPKGAKARLGSLDLRENGSWTGALLLPDGKHLVAPLLQGIVKFDAATGKEAGTLGMKGGGLDRRSSLSRDASRLLNITFAGAAVSEVATGKVLAEVKRTVPFAETAVSFTPDGKFFALGGAKAFDAKDKPVTALVWDVDKNAKVAEVEALQNQMVHTVLSPDGKLLATWGNHFGKDSPKEGVEADKDPNRIVQIWDTAANKELCRISATIYGLHLAFSPDGQVLAVASGNGTIRLVDPKTGNVRRQLFTRPDQGVQLVFSPDGQTLATAGGDGVIQLWNLKDGTRHGTFPCPVGPLFTGVRGIVFTAPDHLAAWSVIGVTAVVWDVTEGKLISPLSGNVGPVRSVAFIADGKELLTGNEFGQVLRWNLEGKELGAIRLQNAGGYGAISPFQANPVRLAPDGKTIMTEQLAGSLYDAATGRQIATFQGTPDLHSYLCRDARTVLLIPTIPFPPKPQPKSLIVGVWDAATGSRMCELELPVGDVVQAALSPDGTKLATAIMTGNRFDAKPERKNEFHLIGWDAKTGKKLGDYSEPGGFGTSFLTLSPDNATALVNVPAGKLLAINLADGKVVKEFDTNRRSLTSPPAFSPDAKHLAITTTTGFGPQATGEILLFEMASGKAVGSFLGHRGAIMCLAFSPDGKLLASGGYDTTAMLWDIAKANPAP